MKFAILSDIHGNIYALEECLKYIKKVNIDAIIWCGDYITDVPKAHEVIEFIKEKTKEYTSYIIKGNREDYILKHHQNENKKEGIGNIVLTYEQLTNEDIEYISNLPDELVIDITEKTKIYVSHKPNMESKYKINIFGHCHNQYMLIQEGRTYISPGSAGNPVDGFCGAEFAILEINDESKNIEMYQIEYDVTKATYDIAQSSLISQGDRWGKVLIKSLETGEDYVVKCIEEGKKIAKERGIKEEKIENFPNEVWDAARKNTGID